MGYWQVLRQNPNFRNLWIGQLISSAGDWFNNVAVLGLALSLTSNGLAAGLVLLASSIPFFIMIPIAGPIVDRFDRRKVMLAANFGGAVLALSFLLVRDSGSVWILFVGSALLITTATFFNPAAQATVPNITSSDELVSASALSSSTWAIMVMAGSGLGGLVSQIAGRETVFIFNSLSFLLANYFIFQVKPPARAKQERIRTSTWADFGEGLKYVQQHLPVMAMVAVKSGWSLAGGVLVLLSVFGTQVFQAGDAGIGALYAGRGLGALIGPFVVKSYIGDDTARTRKVIWWAFLICGFGYLLFATSTGIGLWLAVVALVIAHLGGGVSWMLSSILLQRQVEDQFRGRVFSLDMGMSTLTSSLSTLLWSFSLNWGASPVLLAVIGGATFAVYGMLWVIVSSRGRYNLIT